MPHYAIIIVDPAKHHSAHIARHVNANMRHHLAARPDAGPHEIARISTAVDKAVKARAGNPREVGDLHTTADSECPDGLPNCEHCGDPAYADACAAAGHCPHCGTRHGIAPASYLALSGVELHPIDPPADGHVWDRASRRFVKAKD